MKKRLLLLVLLASLSIAAPAQCVVCTKTASELDSKSARGLNKGIIYLAFLPLGILGTLGVVWWRRNKKSI